MAVWIYIATAAFCFCLVSGNTINLFREGCPYTNFCNINSSRPYPVSNDTVPCCYDCLCDDYCSLFDDCCPDVDQSTTKFNGLKLRCRQARTSSPFADSKSVQHDIPRYRFVDFCPADYRGSSKVVERCERSVDEKSDIEDLVLVSDKQQRVFKNKHCAYCHGVLQIRSWDLNIVECSKNIVEMQLALSASSSFILQNCLLVSKRPSGVPVTSRTLECKDVNVCDFQTNDIQDGCLNGPYMPYIEFQPGGLSRFVIHKNVFCFTCLRQRPWSSLCPVSDEWLKRGIGSNYNLLLNHKYEQPRSSSLTQPECREHELMDPYKGKCRQLFCPPFEMVSYGKCVPLSDGFSSLSVTVGIVYTMQNISVHMPLESLVMYNQSMLEHHVKQINSKYIYPNCKFERLVAIARLDKPTSNFVLLLLKITYSTSQGCSMNYIGEQVRQTQSNQEKVSWFLNDRFYDMDEQFSFYNLEVSEDDPKYAYQTLIFFSKAATKLIPIETVFICPYFILNYKEYINYVERLGNAGEGYNLQDLTPLSRYLGGFFPLFHNEVAGCIQTYLPANSCVRYELKKITLVVTVFVAFLFG